MKKFILVATIAVAMMSMFVLGMQYGIKITAESAVIIEESEYHYAIGYLDNEVEYYYTK